MSDNTLLFGVAVLDVSVEWLFTDLLRCSCHWPNCPKWEDSPDDSDDLTQHVTQMRDTRHSRAMRSTSYNASTHGRRATVTSHSLDGGKFNTVIWTVRTLVRCAPFAYLAVICNSMAFTLTIVKETEVNTTAMSNTTYLQLQQKSTTEICDEVRLVPCWSRFRSKIMGLMMSSKATSCVHFCWQAQLVQLNW